MCLGAGRSPIPHTALCQKGPSMSAFLSRCAPVRRTPIQLQLEVLEDRLVPSGFAYDPHDWPMYNRDPAGTRYNSAESLLSPESVGRLEVKWSLPTEGPVAGTP